VSKPSIHLPSLVKELQAPRALERTGLAEFVIENVELPYAIRVRVCGWQIVKGIYVWTRRRNVGRLRLQVRLLLTVIHSRIIGGRVWDWPKLQRNRPTGRCRMEHQGSTAAIGRAVALPESARRSFATPPLALGESKQGPRSSRLCGHTVPVAKSTAPPFHLPGNGPRQPHTPACSDRRAETAMARARKGQSFAPPRTFRILAVDPPAQRAILARRRLSPQPSQAVLGRIVVAFDRPR
jgi:hypothetical protein